MILNGKPLDGNKIGYSNIIRINDKIKSNHYINEIIE
jgi:hypothetical protein